jgi:hypothetical protein
MGWLFSDDKLTSETPAQYFTREYTRATPTTRYTVRKASAVRGVVYAALRVENLVDGSYYTTALVILFKNSKKDGFGYKDMDESVGPCEVDCPVEIMDMLTPIEQMPQHLKTESAAEWRQRVAARRERRGAANKARASLEPGDVVVTPYPLSFGKRGEFSRFRLSYLRKRTPIFVPIDAEFYCRIRKLHIAAATIEKKTPPPSPPSAALSRPSAQIAAPVALSLFGFKS